MESGDIVQVIPLPRTTFDDHTTTFDLSRCGEYLAIGDTSGNVHILSTSTGKKYTTLTYKRTTKPIHACAFTKHDTNLLIASDSAIWRWDSISEATLAEWKTFHKNAH
jgi:WD40 repeat protein